MHGIQFLRFIAASLVVVYHARIFQVYYFPHFEDKNFDYVAGFGKSGVHIFFVISGFIMAHISGEKFGAPGASIEFLLRRFCRIYPIYWGYAVVYFVVYTLFYSGYQLDSLQFASALLLLPNSAHLVISPAWTLTYEVYFYICFALALSLSGRFGFAALTVFFLLSVLLGRLNILGSNAESVHVNALLLEFLMGTWIVRMTSGSDQYSIGVGWSCVVLAIGFFILDLWVGYEWLPRTLAWGLPSGFLVFGIVVIEKAGRLSQTIHRLSFLGDSSYSLYLIHYFVLQIVCSIIGFTTGNAVWDLGLLLALCVLVAHAAYRWIELPLTETAKRLFLYPYLKRRERTQLPNARV